MKIPRYTLRTLILAMTFTCIVLGGFSPIFQIAASSGDSTTFWMIFALYFPPLVSVGFSGYAIGRKVLTVRMVIAFAVAQAIAIGTVVYLIFTVGTF